MTVPTKTGSPTEESPRKRRKIGITLTQKQALIDNLQLEITERARKLRAQYNLQAQGLRTRIEIRVNRIPMALRKAKMADLLQKHSDDRKQKPAAPLYAAPLNARPPPVPEKDAHMTRPLSQRSAPPVKAPATRPGPGRPPKRTSDELGDTNKENEIEHIGPKKRLRGHPGPEAAPNPSQVLSPQSSNTHDYIVHSELRSWQHYSCHACKERGGGSSIHYHTNGYHADRKES
ncbi:hypothetical protein UCRPA7_7629 [Phaeoacremonium minimum UCRPA7]|uniref:Borealin N-terminal domain-containing protein n=1 Tax=Phaeoacremonium minimum (strain UCR-PA7) TaxID=1286976 RepID=R8BBY3_PHAM7|nr:hypothetical protein UCRPA7_7629 [Phaeoacremonium minimum UCRPA7]EON96805.1 hypothetical protein UCRPA7_7629 [Phaeoacremonium minimum UCRPA7]